MSPDSRYFIEALRRGFHILEVFDKDVRWLSLVDIAARVGLDKSTVFRFVYTLEQLGYLERDPDTKKYRPGLKVMQLGFAALNSLEIAELAQPVLRDLFEETGETTNMTVRDGAEIVYVARISSQKIVSINLSMGSRLPVYCTSMGKAQLLDLSRQELADLLGEGPYERLTKNTITSLDALMAELGTARQHGYTINNEEIAIGLRSTAAPIRERSGSIVAAINLSVPSARVTLRELKSRLAPLVIEASQRISTALGATSGY